MEAKRVKMIEHKGKNILLIDLSNLTAKEVPVFVKKGVTKVRENQERSVLLLINTKNMHFDIEIAELLKSVAKENKEYIRANAVVGVSGLQKVLFHGVEREADRHFKFYENIEEAMDWLVSMA